MFEIRGFFFGIVIVLLFLLIRQTRHPDCYSAFMLAHILFNYYNLIWDLCELSSLFKNFKNTVFSSSLSDDISVFHFFLENDKR